LTAMGAAPTLAPESSDGFASVGTASHRKGRPVAGRPFCFVEKAGEIAGGWKLTLFSTSGKVGRNVPE